MGICGLKMKDDTGLIPATNGRLAIRLSVALSASTLTALSQRETLLILPPMASIFLV